ncbi:MAG: hypothetical protein AAF844_10315 [Pseudomonadota bacterium]
MTLLVVAQLVSARIADPLSARADARGFPVDLELRASVSDARDLAHELMLASSLLLFVGCAASVAKYSLERRHSKRGFEDFRRDLRQTALNTEKFKRLREASDD